MDLLDHICNFEQVMLKSRAGLPMADVKNDLLAKVRDNEVVVIGGETGCGKTTQVCSFLLYKLRYDESASGEADGSTCRTGATIHTG